MHKLATLLRSQVVNSLLASAVDRPSKWASLYRVMTSKPIIGPWTFKYHPWLRDVMDSKARIAVARKAAQMGFSEAAINRIFFMMDVRKASCMYVLPNLKPDASDFSASRFDPALEGSKHLAEMFTDTRNIGLKRAGGSSLFIRGSKSRAGLKSVPAAFVVFDELEEMMQENIALAFERASGQAEEDVAYFLLSTPLLANMGIDKWFLNTNQQQYVFKCPHCSRLSEMIYPDSLVVYGESDNDPEVERSHYICHQCKHPLDQLTKPDWLSLNNASWQKMAPGSIDDGWSINQMYSMFVTPVTMAKKVHRAKVSPEDEQELYNSKLGLPHEVKGARILDSDIQAVLGGHRKGKRKYKNSIVTIGCDVGTNLHFEVTEYTIPNIDAEDINAAASAVVIDEGSRRNFDELDDLIIKYQIQHMVIDANPERREAYKLAQRFPGTVSLCFYGNKTRGKTINVDAENSTITVDRTTWMDMALRRFSRLPRRISLPVDVSLEYKNHIKAPIRVYGRDSDGNPVGSYVHSDSEPDHLAHCRTYSEIALARAVHALGVTEDIE